MRLIKSTTESFGPHCCQSPDQQANEESQGYGAGKIEEWLKLVRTDVNEGQADDAEDEVCEELSCCRASACRQTIRDTLFKVGVP